MKLVIQNTSAVWGGNEKWLANVAAGLASRGHDIVVSCPGGAVRQGVERRGIRTSRFRPRGSVDVVSGLSFAAWLGREAPDTLLLTSWHSLSWSAWSARVARIPRLVLRQGIVRTYPATGHRHAALQRVDAVIANSTEIQDIWDRSAPPSARGRVKVVLNGIEPRKDRREAARNTLRGELGLEESTILIGGSGHIFPRKGFDFLLRAFAIANVPDSQVAIAGHGDQKPELERLAAELGIVDRVHWLGHRDKGPDVVAGFDLFVLSSHSEGMANVMLEAMAGGVPVIASDISGVRKAIGATEFRQPAGWIVPPADAPALASAIGAAASLVRLGSDVVRARVEEAHWRIEHWFGIDRMIDECEAILFG